MKEYIKFVYSKNGIDDLESFSTGLCTDFKKMRHPNAIGECTFMGKIMYEGSYLVKNQNRFEVVSESNMAVYEE